jgi:superkiller protein 3
MNSGPSAISQALFRVLVVALVVGIAVAGVYVLRAVSQKASGRQGPRSIAELQIQDAEAAVKKNPDSAKARIDLAKAYGVVGRYTAAIRQLKLAGKIDPKSAEVPFLMGAAYHKMGNYDNTVKYLNDAVAVKGQFAEFYSRVYFELGQAHSEHKKHKEAIKAYDEALTNAPMASDIMYELGRSYEAMGDKKEAIAWYNDALIYDPELAEPREALKRLGSKPEHPDKVTRPAGEENTEEPAKEKAE